jgi:hypothetical protein
VISGPQDENSTPTRSAAPRAASASNNTPVDFSRWVVSQRGKRLGLECADVVGRGLVTGLRRRDQRDVSVGPDRGRGRELPVEPRPDEVLHVRILSEDHQVEPFGPHHIEQAFLPRARSGRRRAIRISGGRHLNSPGRESHILAGLHTVARTTSRLYTGAQANDNGQQRP